MLKNLLRHELFQKVTGLLIAYYLKICFQTSVWNIKNEKVISKLLRKKKKIIVCFWHSKLLMMVFCWNYPNKFKMLISGHRDGKIISNAVSHFGIETISGSSRKNMISSLKQIIFQLNQKNVVGITPDGPKGPKEKIKNGLVSLIKKTDAVIVPLTYSARFKITLNTWDNFLMVFPFNKFVAVWGVPFNYNSNCNFEENKKKLQDEFERLEKLSKNLSS